MMSRTPRRLHDVIQPREGPRGAAGVKANRASETAHVSRQVGAWVALNRRVVSERGGGRLAAAAFVLPGNRRTCRGSVWLSPSYVQGRYPRVRLFGPRLLPRGIPR